MGKSRYITMATRLIKEYFDKYVKNNRITTEIGENIAVLNAPGMQQFDPHSDPTSLAVRRNEWLTRFKRYVIGFDIKNKARKLALLLYLAGPKVEKIFSTLTDTDEENDYDTAEAKLTAYFAPKKNIL